MVHRAGQASAWPGSLVSGLRPLYGVPPIRVATVDGIP
ncbi:hypothetical protein J3Q09_23785 [Pseudomonas sp. R4-83]